VRYRLRAAIRLRYIHRHTSQNCMQDLTTEELEPTQMMKETMTNKGRCGAGNRNTAAYAVADTIGANAVEGGHGYAGRAIGSKITTQAKNC
jgi:hypothetical protein